MMVAFIDEHHEERGVEPICDILPVPPSTYYAHKAAQADPEKRSERARNDDTLSRSYGRFGMTITRSMEPARCGASFFARAWMSQSAPLNALCVP